MSQFNGRALSTSATLIFEDGYHISSVIRWSFFFQNNPKDLDPYFISIKYRYTIFLQVTKLIRIRTKATSLFSSSPLVHHITHEMADKLCVTMLKQNRNRRQIFH